MKDVQPSSILKMEGCITQEGTCLSEPHQQKGILTNFGTPKENSSQKFQKVSFKRSYRVKYLGCDVLDRSFTTPMLPWITAEIKRKGMKDAEEIRLEVTESSLKGVTCVGFRPLFEHKLKNITKFVQTQEDRSCFTYLVRSTEETPFICHVFHATDEGLVLELFTTMREMMKGSTPLLTRMGSSLGFEPFSFGLQHFEVLYVGKIKVSHKRAPPSFIDEAVERFQAYETEKSKSRARHSSGSSINNLEEVEGVNQLIVQVERCGSTSSQEGINSGSVESLASYDGNQSDRSNSSEQCSALSPVSPDSSLSESSSVFTSLVTHSQSMDTAAQTSVLQDLRQCALANNNNNNTLLPPSHDSFVTHTQSLDVAGKASLIRDLQTCALGQRVRSASGDIPRATKQNSLPFYRSRAGSGGSFDLRRQKEAGQRSNRTMLFLIGRSELCLMNTERKVLLSKTFSDISHCCKGITHADHFGFICRESLLTSTDTYVGYVFRCPTKNVVDEIMQGLKQAFNSAHQAYQKQQASRGGQLCESCPMHWFHRLCIDLEGVPPDKAQLVIIRRMKLLTDLEQEDIMMKYQGAESINVQEQNEVFMMLLRGMCEQKQMKHVHQGNFKYELEKKFSGSKLDSLKQKAKKSLSTSFDNILKRKSKEDLRERSYTTESDGLHKYSDYTELSPPPTNKREGSYDFPDATVRERNSPPSPRPRSSTIGTVREALKTRQKSEPGGTPTKSPIMNIFMKVGHQSKPAINGMNTPSSHLGPWRQAIFHRVQTPITKVEPQQLAVEIRKSPGQLRALWKKAIMEQIILIRMDKENKRLQVNQDAASYKRMKLDYEEITPCLKEAAKEWDDLLSAMPDNVQIDCKRLKEVLRAGIPRNKRGEIWQFLAQQQRYHLRTEHSDDSDPAYEDLLKQLTPHQHAILIDLGRTFPSHPYFSQPLGPGQLSLFNLLKAYSLLDQDVGYCQGLSFVAGILLLHMPEGCAFKMMKHILFRLGFRKQYKPDMVALQIQMYQLSRLIHDTYRDVYEHFERHEIVPTLYAAPWFLTIFASQFPLGFVSRLFDLIFLQGMEAVFKVALVLLGEHRDQILQCGSFESVMDFLKSYLPAMGIIQMERVFSQVFSLDLQAQLMAYEVEYHVLQEATLYPSNQQLETPSPDSASDVKALQAAKRELTQQNNELLDQLQVSAGTVQILQSSVTSHQSTVKRLEQRLRSVEDERDALLHSVNVLRRRLEQLEKTDEEESSSCKRTPSLGAIVAMTRSEDDLGGNLRRLSEVESSQERGSSMDEDEQF